MSDDLGKAKRIKFLETENARLRETIDDVVCGRGMFGVDALADLQWAINHLATALPGTKQEIKGKAGSDVYY